MAFSDLYWPPALPTKGLLQGWAPGITSTITRTNMAEGPARQRGWGQEVIKQITVAYSMTRDQVDVLDSFCQTTGGRSFWMPYPDPLSRYAKDGLWRYARLRAASQSEITTPQARAGNLYDVTLGLDFWVMVPGQAPPSGT